MNTIDWAIISSYLLGMIGLSIYWGKNQANQEDYYVAGRKLSWWTVGISTMATQTSAISFISKPAFVALKPGGGLTWLQYEMAVPLAIIVIMIFLVPFFRKLKLVSVYEYLELRFGPSIRYLVSGVFLVSRGLAAGVVVYATGIVLAVCLNFPLWITILIIGFVTILYDTIGGITAVVYSDVIQMILLTVGIVVCIFYAADSVGGFAAILNSFPTERLHTIDLSTGLGDGSHTPFWGFLVGGFFLFVSYYGTDQSQVQRELSADSIAGSKKSLFLNGLARFPLGILYILLGLAVGAVYQQSPELRAAVPADHLDYLVPQYIILHLPSGVRALLIAALLAATMSSLDSVLNALSASTMRDFISKHINTDSNQLLISKAVTVVWGIIITIFAFWVEHIEDTVVESINKIGSTFYGPILAAFLVGIMSKKVNSTGIFSGIIAGVGFNLFLWQFMPDVYWMWWNAFGLVITTVIAYLVSYFYPSPVTKDISRYTLNPGDIYKEERSWLPFYGILFFYFIGILAILIWVESFSG